MKFRERKTWIGLVLVMIVILLVGAWRFTSELSKTELSREMLALEKLADEKTDFINQKLLHQVNALKNIANLTLADGIDQKETIISNKVNKIFEIGEFSKIGIADIKGNAVTTLGEKKNVSQTNFFMNTMKGKDLISEVVEIDHTQEKSVIISTPIYSDYKTVGVVYGVMNLKRLTQDIDSVLYDDLQCIQIVDSSGNFILKTKNDKYYADEYNIYNDMEQYKLENMNVNELKENISQKKSGYFEYEYNGSKQYVHYIPLDMYNWYVFTITPLEAIQANIGTVSVLVFDLFMKVVLCFVIVLIYVTSVFKRTNQAIRTSHDELNEFSKVLTVVLQKTQDSVFELSPKTSVIKIYRGKHLSIGQELLEIMPSELIDAEIIAPEFVESFVDYLQNDIMQPHSELVIKLKLDTDDYEWAKITTTAIYENNQIINIIGFIRNYTQEKEMELLYEQERRYRNILVDNAIFSCEVDLKENQVLSRNGESCIDEHVEYGTSVYETVKLMIHHDYREDVLRYASIDYLLTMFQKGQEQLKYEFLRKDEKGLYIWIEMIARVYENENHQIIALIVLNDINEQKQKEMELSYKAHRDLLTTLYNRETLVAKIDEYLSYPDMARQHHALLLVDLDNFKELNDTLGHDIGDKALKDVSSIMKKKFRTGDLIGRLGGDEFVIFCKSINDPSFVGRVAKELGDLLRIEYVNEGKSVCITASIGVALVPEDGRNFNELYVKADHALYDVKREHKDGFKVYKE